MLQNTTQEKQAMGSDKAQMEARPNSDTGVVRTRDEATLEEETTLEGEEESLADDTQGDRSTVSTEWSHNKKVFSPQASPILEAETDPTSIPSGLLEDLVLERKCTESPLNSMEAVQESDSVHSAQSDPSTGDDSSRDGGPIAVNAEIVTAIGDHFGDSTAETPPPRFHDPKTSWEAQHITKKIRRVNGNSLEPTVSQSSLTFFADTMDDIDRNPEACFQDHGSSFQVSARPKESADYALDAEDDIGSKRKVHFPPDSVLRLDIDERCNTGMPRKRTSPCCAIM